MTPLQQSIAKWENIVAGNGHDEAFANCALCKVHSNCNGCPVKAETGMNGCCDTPYSAWNKYWIAKDVIPGYGRMAHTEHEKELAIAELKFLQSLLRTQT